MLFDSIEALMGCFNKFSVHKIIFKLLADNDNSKNQVYLGGDYSAVQIVPFGNMRTEQGASGRNAGKCIVKAALDFSWITDGCRAAPAPNAQLILYPQYPEVRFSGFLKGCNEAPSELMNVRDAGRVLFLGLADNDKIYGYVAASDSALAAQSRNAVENAAKGNPTASDLQIEKSSTVFWEILDTQSQRKDTFSVLCEKLKEIHLLGWINSFRLNPATGEKISYQASNGAGYTLEGMFGIMPNGIPAPDYLDWELKSGKVSKWPLIPENARITLMTPEPATGLYCDDISAFVERYTTVRNDGSRYFTGTRTAGVESGDSLSLVLRGVSDGKIRDVGSAGIFLLDTARDNELVAGWPVAAMLEHWRRKHRRTAFVFYDKLNRLTGDNRINTQYRFSNNARFGEGYDFRLLLKAFEDGNICYDPAVKFVPKKNTGGGWTIHRRNQFRTVAAKIQALYKSCTDVDLLTETEKTK